MLLPPGKYPSSLNRWFRTTNTFDRFGVAFDRFCDAGLRSRTTGREATTNGRIWFFSTGVIGFARSIVAWLAAGISCTAGIRLRVAGATTSANAWTFCSVWVACWSVPGSRWIACETPWLAFANAWNTFELESISWTIWPWLCASAVFSTWSEWISDWRFC